MKKYINYIKIFTFCFIFLILLQVLSQVFTPKDNTLEAGYHNISANGFLSLQRETIDVLFLGNSLSYSNFIPLKIYKDYGFTSHNLGTASQRTYQSYAYLENFLKYHKPKVVVYEIGNLLSDFNLSYAMYSEMGRYFDFFDYHDRWKNLHKEDFVNKVNFTYSDSNRGYKNVKKVIKAKKKNYMKKTNDSVKISDGNVYFFKKIINLLRKEKIEILLVSSVSMKSMNYSNHNSFNKLADDNNCKYLDLNLTDEIKIDWEKDSYDGGEHLNFNGAIKVSSYIGNYLKNTYELPDHRNDDNYSSWNELALK